MKTPPPIKKKNDSSSAEYFVHVNEEQLGPYDFEKIKILLEFKNIDKNTLIWKEGMDDWDIISNLEEFKIQIDLSEEEKKYPKEKVIKNQKESIGIKINSTRIDYIKLFNITSVITLVASCLALFGAVQQYIQFLNYKEIDNSYIGPFSIWGALISVILSLISIIYLIRNKTKFLMGSISLVVGVSAFFILMYTESKFRFYWRPYWDRLPEMQNIHKKKLDEMEEDCRKGLISEDSAWDRRTEIIESFYKKLDEIQEGWGKGLISEDSLNRMTF